MGQSCQKLSCIRTLKKRKRLASERHCTSQVYIGTTPEYEEVTLFQAYNTSSAVQKPAINRSVVSLVQLTDTPAFPNSDTSPHLASDHSSNFLTIPGSTRAAPLSNFGARGVPLPKTKPYKSIQQVRISPLPRPSSPLPTEALSAMSDSPSDSVVSLRRSRVAPYNNVLNGKLRNARRINSEYRIFSNLGFPFVI